jgi:uncharacterized protein YbjT (DUF2867 family)
MCNAIRRSVAVTLRSAVVLGATGLVGNQLVRILVRDPECAGVVAVGRRLSGLTAPTLRDVTADLAAPATYREQLNVDCVFCALGTTIKKAGSEDAFRRVDFEYPFTVAREAANVGAGRFVLVSAVGANSASRVFYNRVKGELEEALRALPFPRGIRVLRPSVLLGERSESRPGERVAATLMKATAPLFAGALKKYRAITAEDVARAMVTAARSEGDGVVVYEGATLFAASQGAAAAVTP